MMKNIILFIPVLCLLCGCVYSKDVYTSDGDLAYNIVCGGTLNSWDNCYTKAGKICKEKGYEILKQDEGQYDIPLNPGQSPDGHLKIPHPWPGQNPPP